MLKIILKEFLNKMVRLFLWIFPGKIVEKAVVVRPQNPVKPYPYYSEDVKFDNGKDKITLAGTLTLTGKGRKFSCCYFNFRKWSAKS